MRTLYERAGGGSTVAAVVDQLYRHLVDDPSLAHHFDPDRLDHLRARQRLWFRSVLGDPTAGGRPDLGAAHEHVAITDRDVAGLLAHLDDALVHCGVGSDARRSIVALVARLWYAREF